MKKFILIFIAVLSVTMLMAQPPNDSPCNAIALTLDDDCAGTLPYTNEGATSELGESLPDCFPDAAIDNSVWFTFVAPVTGAVSISTDFPGSGLNDSQLAVYTLDGDCAEFDFTEVACNEDIIPDPDPDDTQFNAGLPPISVDGGVTYYIQVDGFNNDPDPASEGTFCIVVSSVTPPVNDECSNLDAYGGFGPLCTKIREGTTIGATSSISSVDSLACDSDGYNATVFYSFLVPAISTNGLVEFNLLSGTNINVTVFTNPDMCEVADGSVEVPDNCFTNISASPMEDPMDPMPELLFSGLTPGDSYLMAIWTNEGEATDFSFCLTRAPEFSCGDDVCYDLAENYTNCPADCPCISNIDFVSYTSGTIVDSPTGVCAEILGGTTDLNNPGIYIPFVVSSLDSDLTGSSVTTSMGSLFTSNTPINSFGILDPLVPLNPAEANDFVNYVFLTDAEIAAGGTVTINFTSDNGACNASLDVNLADLIAPAASECGNCNLQVTPDYSTVQCPDYNVELNIEGGIGDLWIGQNNTTVFDTGDEAGFGNNDIPLPYTGGYPDSDFTFAIYDSGQPNCAFITTVFIGDFLCPPEGEGPPQTVCRLEASIDETSDPSCADNGNVFVPINFGRPTGTISSTPDVITGNGTEADPYGILIDPDNCTPLDITFTDESEVSIAPSVVVNAPASIEGPIPLFGTNVDGDGDGMVDFGIDINTLPSCGTNTGEVTGQVVLADDGVSDPPSIFCDPMSGGMPTANQCAGIAGNILMIDRGGCAFTNKAENAQSCGAIGVIICNNVANAPVSNMVGDAVFPITIPTVFLTLETCAILKAELENGVIMCLGAGTPFEGCEATLSVDVCDQLPTDCTVEGCMDPCDPNFNPDATVDSDPSSCAGYDRICDDMNCATIDSYDDATCSCVNTSDPNLPLDCDDGDCSTIDAYDEATCTCSNTPDPNLPLDCDDGDCATIDTYDPATCTCSNTPDPNLPLDCDDMNCATIDSYDEATCSCVNTPDPNLPLDCDDLNCATIDSYDETTCSCVNTPDPNLPLDCDDGDCSTIDTYDEATCSCVNMPDPNLPLDCDDMDCSTIDVYDPATCTCSNTPDPNLPLDCDDGDCNTEDSYDEATCSCVNTTITVDPNDDCEFTDDSYDPATCTVSNVSNCPAGTTLNTGNCSCTTDVVDGCTDPCDPVFNPASTNEVLCEGYDTVCDDMDCATIDSYDSVNCTCVNTPDSNLPLDCDDMDCATIDAYDAATCSCTNTADPNLPLDCDDGDCATIDVYDEATCSCSNTPDPNLPLSCDDGDCTNGEETYNEATCACEPGTPPTCADGERFNAETCMCETIPDTCDDPCAPNFGAEGACEAYSTDCDDSDCSTIDSYDTAACACVNTPDPNLPLACDDGDCSNGEETYNAATCACDAGTPPTCADGERFNAETCMCELIPATCDDPCAPNFGAEGTCESYSTDCDDSDCSTIDSYDTTACACVNTPDPNLPLACDDGDCSNGEEIYNTATCSCDAGTPPTCGDGETFNAETCMCETITIVIEGCMNMEACNYNPDANMDDGACIVVQAATINGGPFTFCVGDGVADFVSDITVDGGVGSNTAWVITDDQLNILGLPPMPGVVDFDPVEAGTCLIWYLVFEDITGAEVGLNAADLGGCFALSNSIEVIRQPAGCTDPNASNFNPDAQCDDDSCITDECVPPSAGDFDCE